MDSRSRSRNKSQPVSINTRLTVEREPAAATSLLSASRLSLSNSYPDLAPRTQHVSVAERSSPLGYSSSPPSPEDGSNFRRSLQIDMKDLVGDAVGNMSISPTSRDIVLAARRGLFIIDLESPFQIPRFLPQGGCWDVADLQWNPHRVRAEYIVSTSSVNLLIWNLLLVGKNSIEHILRAHVRAITDVNWHNSEPDIVVSTGIDSWLWVWDLRETRKPVLGLSAFNAAGTQVKWNRQEPHILASSHLDSVSIWDRRKGSLPVQDIKAHTAKIYGIDWSHKRRNEIVTCSLDKTIKVWDIHASHSGEGQREPKTTISTNYPVWRARSLPFGQGVLSLPQRGETTLEMFAYDDELPVHTFDGHTDVVKEFVWRRGGKDSAEFQLITWSKDRTLRFWPVDTTTMQRFGHSHTRKLSTILEGSDFTFRNPPKGMELPPALSAPVGHRSILAEVRADPPPSFLNLVSQPHRGSAARATFHEKGTWTAGQFEPGFGNALESNAGAPATPHGGRMVSGWKVARMDPLAWLASVKVGGKREDSSGPGSGGNSRNGSQSRVSSTSSQSSDHENLHAPSVLRKASEGVDKPTEERREGEGNQSLQDEITSVISRLATSKIKLERHDLSKKRTCTLGLNGPWGESSSVFIRVSFTFPRDYPQAVHPQGTPTVDLERNPLIPLRTHVFIVKRLRCIREQRRPCLEPCLRFLLFGHEGGASDAAPIDLESSEDESVPGSRKSREAMVALVRSTKNLGEPRTSQAVFAPSGELVCFQATTPRIVRRLSGDVSVTSAKSSHALKSPALVTDAIRRLNLASLDRPPGSQECKSLDRRANGGQDILRIMTNLFTYSRPTEVPDLDAKHVNVNETTGARQPIVLRRSVVHIMSTVDSATPDRRVAAEYVFVSGTVEDTCEQNAIVAHRYGRFDHERIFRMMQAVASPWDGSRDRSCPRATKMLLAHTLAMRLYSELSAKKDVQMLAMLSVIFFQACGKSTGFRRDKRGSLERKQSHALLSSPALQSSDYFSLEQCSSTANSPEWPRLCTVPPGPQPPPPMIGPQLSSSNSSRGSWSSLFNTGSMRQFVAGVQDTFKDGLVTPADAQVKPSDRIPESIAVPKVERSQRPSASPRHTGLSKGASLPSMPVLSKSWSEIATMPMRKPTISFSSAGDARPLNFPHVAHSRYPFCDKRIVFEHPQETNEDLAMPLNPQQLERFACHMLAYAEVLQSWQLPKKRLELLKFIHQWLGPLMNQSLHPTAREHDIGLIRVCPSCHSDINHDHYACSACSLHASKPLCSVCRLPVKGLSRTCLRCLHVAHFGCWNAHRREVCPSGCGCICLLAIEPDTVSLVRSPSSMLSALPPIGAS